jgi:hypothetical protein
VTRSGDDRGWEARLRDLERVARARARGERYVVPDARSPVCEICGSTDVHWGALCTGCRERLQAAAGRPRG